MSWTKSITARELQHLNQSGGIGGGRSGDVNNWSFDCLPSLHQRSLVTPVFANIPTNDDEQYIEQVVECPTDN